MPALTAFVTKMQALVDQEPNSDRILSVGAGLLRFAISDPDIVPKEFRLTSTKRHNHGTYNVYRGKDLFVSVSVWGPGDRSDPHNHGTWGLIGVVENAIQETRYRITRSEAGGTPVVERTGARLLKAGDISILKPDEDEIHELDNFSERNTIELHIYGKNLVGLDRFAFDRSTGQAKPFRSGKYDNC